MPELPEVETIVRTLSPQIRGKRISAVRVLNPKTLQCGAEYTQSLVGASITRVFRRAKLLLLEVVPPPVAVAACEPLLLAFHLKMTGRFFVHPAGTEPEKHTRLIFDLENDGRLFFDDARKFGFCRIMKPEALAEWPFWQELGPEPLERTARELAAHLKNRFSGKRVAIKAALLDQRMLAGIGNIYADEALFKARIVPTAQAGSVNLKKLEALAEALQAVLRRSIEECGSSIRDYRDALGNAGAFQNNFAVYGRKGEHCVVCGRPLAHCRVAGRGTVHCPHCQKTG